MKTLLLSVLIMQAIIFPLYVFLGRRGFLYLLFPFFKLIGHALAVVAILITAEKTLAVQIGVFLYIFLIADEMMGMETLYRIYSVIMLRVFKKDLGEGFSFIPMINITFMDNVKFQFEKDCDSMVFLAHSLYHRNKVLSYANHDILIKGACGKKTISQFLAVGWYGEEVAKMVVVGILLFFI